MKKPIKSRYKTESGYQRALKKYNDFVKANKTTKKPVAKKPVAKKPVAKKPVAKKPVAKKSANNLRIKKAANTAVKTTKQAIKKATPVVKKAASTVRKKAGEVKQAVNKFRKTPVKKNPAPKTPAQKLFAKANKSFKSYSKDVIKQGATKFKKGSSNIKDPKMRGRNVGGAKAALGAEIIRRGTNALVNRAFKPKNMTMAEYEKAKAKSNKEGVQKAGKRVKKAIKGVVNKFRGKSNNTTTKKTTTTKPSSKLKIAQDRVKKAKGYNKEKLQREVDYLKKLGKQPRTFSNPVGAEGKGKPSSVKQETLKAKPKSKYIKTASGSLARRGTVNARRAENREKARKRAQEMARKRLANK